MSAYSPPQSRYSYPSGKPAGTQWTVRRKTAPIAVMPPLTQRFQISVMDPSGNIVDAVRMGPAIALFQQAFSALARGALITTVDGPVAVEDILPGTLVQTENGIEQLLWKGCQTIHPATQAGLRLFRIPADALGLGRPAPDLMLGPSARLVSRRSDLRDRLGTDAALVPINALADGMNIVEITPISAVQTYHLGFARHCVFPINGIEVESVHPGTIDPLLGDDLGRLYLSLFPHFSDLRDFGPLTLPRVSEADLIDG